MTREAAGGMNDVDVLIRCHDSATDIVATVRSVLRQTQIGCRVWLIDDASTDDTVEQIKSIADPRLTLLEHRSLLAEAASLNALPVYARLPYLVVKPDGGVARPGG